MSQITDKVIVSFQLELRTGMRIGGGDPGIAIGAIDNTVIRDPVSQQPYIPGSSLKGKLRSALERVRGEFRLQNNQAGPSRGFSEVVCARLFGVPAEETAQEPSATRLIVRDSFLTPVCATKLDSPEYSRYLDARFTEVKTEVGIDRLKGGANQAGPRQMERVPRGSQFDCEIVVTFWDVDNNPSPFPGLLWRQAMLSALSMSLTLLETEYLGGNGSRGYGQVRLNRDTLRLKHLVFEDGSIRPVIEAHPETLLPFISIYDDDFGTRQLPAPRESLLPGV